MQAPRIGVVIHTPLRDQLFSQADRRRLERLGEVVWTTATEKLTVEQACELLADCEVGIGSWGTPYPDAQLLEACPRLRLWEHVAGTVKHMFGPHLEGRNLTIASCATAIADCVAEMTLGEIILGLRRVFENAEANRHGRTGKPANLKVLYESTVGVIGASAVGQRVMKLLQPFGCEILLCDPFCAPDQARRDYAAELVDLPDLCARSDVVTLHTPALPSTEKLLGPREFAAMRDDAVFINTARGMCIDEYALIKELARGRLFAMLDVSSPEPPSDDSPLRSLPNVVYTSHIAGPPSKNMGAQAVDDVGAFLGGGKPMRVVTGAMLERLA